MMYLILFIPLNTFRNANYSQNYILSEAKWKLSSVGIHVALAMHETEISLGNENKGCLLRKDKELYIDTKWPESQGQNVPLLNHIYGVLGRLYIPPMLFSFNRKISSCLPTEF